MGKDARDPPSLTLEAGVTCAHFQANKEWAKPLLLWGHPRLRHGGFLACNLILSFPTSCLVNSSNLRTRRIKGQPPLGSEGSYTAA